MTWGAIQSTHESWENLASPWFHSTRHSNDEDTSSDSENPDEPNSSVSTENPKDTESSQKKQLAEVSGGENGVQVEDPQVFLARVRPSIPTLRLEHSWIDTNAGIPYSNFAQEFVNVLDYIFCDPFSLRVLSTGSFPTRDVLSQNLALPADSFPSDHMPVVTDFAWQ